MINLGFHSKEDAAVFILTQTGMPLANHTLRAIMDSEPIRKATYRAAAARLHPDSPTGNHDLFVKLGQALAMLEAN